MKPLLLVAALVLVAGASTGCAHASYVPTARFQPAGPKPYDDVLMTYTKPLRPNTTTGRIQANATTIDKSLSLLRDRAAALGLDGISEIYCAGDGDEQGGSCSGNGFVWGVQ